MTHLRHIHTHIHHYSIDYTPPNIWLVCLQHLSMPTHKFADQTNCCFYFIFLFFFLITPSYILRPLDITALRGSVLHAQTSFLVLCVWNVQVYMQEQMYNINIWIWPRFLSLPFFVNSFFVKCSFSMPRVHLTGKSPANQHIWSLKVRSIWCLSGKHQISVQSLLERY